MPLNGRVVMVTGAGRGIGSGIAEAVFRKGANVLVTDLDEDAAAASVERICEVTDESERIAAASLDVRDSESIDAAINVAITRWSKLDGLVNNAGVLLDRGPVLESDPELREKEFAVNYEGTLRCAQMVAQQIIAQASGGNIVNVASEGALRAHILMGNYSATKAAIVNLTQCLSAEWAAHGINVNAICPGGVPTEMLAQAADTKAQLAANGESCADGEALMRTWLSPQLGRPMEAVEVGNVAAFLLSEDAVLVRGQTIRVSAGIEHESMGDFGV